MEAVTRFGNIPIIETGFKAAEDAYTRIKSSNRLFNWYLDTAEAALLATVESFLPAIRLFEGPLRRIDKIMCKSLDLVEQRVPAVYLPPQMMYWNTKEYMSDRLVKPVLKRADSVKQLGSAVLELPITEFAADRIDGAITVADKYVDKYLPVEGNADQVDGNLGSEPNEKDKAAIKAIYHGTRFSRKLKRRLTARTILEARALKKQGKEAIHVLLYAAELIVKDPKQALQKARELWAYLSADEPENQARPQTLEQLLVLLTRESARRVVHLLNYTTAVAASIPRTVNNTTNELIHQAIYVSDVLIKMAHLEKAKVWTAEEIRLVAAYITRAFNEMQVYGNNTLERLVVFLSGRIEAEKITTNSSRRRIHARTNNNPMQNNLNGVY